MKLNYVTEDIKKEMICFRRLFHKYPERAYTEYKTTYEIYKYLSKLGFRIFYGEEFFEGDVRKGRLGDAEKGYERALMEGVPLEFLEKMKYGNTGLAAEMVFGKKGKKNLLLRLSFKQDFFPCLRMPKF